jgi:hypothetical protein
MVTHKIANDFIRKYNKHISIKNYSKLKLDEKMRKIDVHVKRVGGALEEEWRLAKTGQSKKKKKKRTTKELEDAANLLGLSNARK